MGQVTTETEGENPYKRRTVYTITMEIETDDMHPADGLCYIEQAIRLWPKTVQAEGFININTRFEDAEEHMRRCKATR